MRVPSRLLQDNAAAVGGDPGDSRSDAGVGRSHAPGGFRQPLGRHHKGLDQSEAEHQDSRARLAGQREHLTPRSSTSLYRSPDLFMFRPDVIADVQM